MIPEREREALMRLTMCAREECGMCKYKDTCNFEFQYEIATENMNILADALKVADTPQNERSEFVKVSDRECPWCKAVCASTDKYCHECGWHIADTLQTEEQRIVQEAEHRMANIIADMNPQTDCGWGEPNE